MRKIITIVFMFICANAFSQKILVLDESKQPVSFASYFCKQNNEITHSGYCDEKGAINLPPNISFQTMEISCIGYESLIVNNQKWTDTIYLKKNIVELKEVVIKTKPKSIQLLGFTDQRKNSTLSAYKGMEICVFIDNPDRTPKIIKSFLLKMKHREDFNTGIRIHLYSKDSLTLVPGVELLNRNIFRSIQKNHSVVEISNDDRNLVLPSEGCFLGIEWLGDFDEETGEFHNVASVEINDEVNSLITFVRNRLNADQAWRNMEGFKKDSALYAPFKNYPNASFGLKVFN